MESKTQGYLVAWECRYISNSIPTEFTHEVLDAQFYRSSDESEECDIYCFGKDPNANIKIRRRTNTLKLKVRIAADLDGFELWKTVFNHRLPVPSDKWDVIASYLGVQGPQLMSLHGVTSPNTIIREIDSNCPGLKTVEVYKTRRFYRKGLAQLEVAKGHYGDAEFYSVQYESENVIDAQALRESYPPHNMGSPCSYTTFLERTL